jgi:predicted RNA-binding protein with EMAP domain
MDEIKALKEKLKKKNEKIKSLRKLLEYHKEHHYMYHDWWEDNNRKINIYQDLMPCKYYKITYEIWKEGKIEERGTEMKPAPHYSLAILELKMRAIKKQCSFKLIDILEVAS